MGSVFIISETTPDGDLQFKTADSKYLWLKPLPDGSLEYYNSSKEVWVKALTIPASALANHTHPDIDHVPDIVTLLGNGITGTKTIGNYKFTFNHGVLTGFEPV